MNLRQLALFCESFTTPPNPVLYELERETYLKTIAPQMASGRLQGQFLRFLSWMLRPKRILEIGTFTGYSTICLAEGLAETGLIHTIEVNPELAYFGKKYFAKAGLADRIIAHIGDAFDLIPTFEETFDLAFIDSRKDDYAALYDLVLDKVRPGGFLLADNVLWDGKVISGAKDGDTRTIQTFIQKIHDDPRVENVLLPVRDGVLLIRKL
ncbi:MAG: O-methyltransferase [Saprospirales bacterium]|nr:O-methyltransferase [Saprospirales bacterium]MBK8491561.1 O-methyltransferase [Saprospirales bacterium]